MVAFEKGNGNQMWGVPRLRLSRVKKKGFLVKRKIKND